jgi:hypothetical protein
MNEELDYNEHLNKILYFLRCIELGLQSPAEVKETIITILKNIHALGVNDGLREAMALIENNK